ncbi:MAG TPA: PEGA domain-containing protein, partial [Polyangium sp.]|nr:PEGA domain-containing protein [Polyangium sp.]
SVTLVLKIVPIPSIWLDDKPVKGNPTTIEGLSADEEHKLVLQANGHVPKTIKFTAKQGETKTIQEILAKLDPNAKQGDPSSGTTPPASGAGGTGKVRVTSKGGFCNVTINGTGYGATPVEAVVKEGSARVNCKPDSGAALSQVVQVKAGDVARVSFKL